MAVSRDEVLTWVTAFARELTALAQECGGC